MERDSKYNFHRHTVPSKSEGVRPSIRVEDSVETLKRSQNLLISLIEKLVPLESSLMKSIPQDFAYVKNAGVIDRLVATLEERGGGELEKQEKEFNAYMRVLDPKLSLGAAKQRLVYATKNKIEPLIKLITDRIYVEGDVLNYYNKSFQAWEEFDMSFGKEFTKWGDHPVFKLPDGRYFIPVPMHEGAAISIGEGKKRGYVFNDGVGLLHIDGHIATYTKSQYSDTADVQPGGLMIDKYTGLGSVEEHIKRSLEGFKYYPNGTVSRESKSESIVEGVIATAIPVEYGKDEWDNPVRIFQDIIQNHIDATLGVGGITLKYEVVRDGSRLWVDDSEIAATDEIVGLTVSDNGEGYGPGDIATMGASSKRSPLFAGKYGEGQKMVAAAALRGGLTLEYRSTLKVDGQESVPWVARAVTEDRKVVLGGEEVHKKIVAFDVSTLAAVTPEGSSTSMRLKDNATHGEILQWQNWMKVLDPRIKDKGGHSGLARYVRQLRKPGSERRFTLGSITLLLDEPGAVYENGLRINPEAEVGRDLIFGYDVPEVVTTRERNSYDSSRLTSYSRHIISHISEPEVIEEVLKRMTTNSSSQDSVLHFWSLGPTASWTRVAQKLWPGMFVHCPEAFEFESMSESVHQMRKRIEMEERAKFIKNNLPHFDPEAILFVSKVNYSSFSRILPSLESAMEKLKTERLEVDPETKMKLASIVAESARVYIDFYNHVKSRISPDEFKSHPLLYFDLDIARVWSLPNFVLTYPDGVALAPIDSGFHGAAEKGVTFNEALLLKVDRRRLAEVALHEMGHILSGFGDYTEGFVVLLYELAKYLREKSDSKNK